MRGRNLLLSALLAGAAFGMAPFTRAGRTDAHALINAPSQWDTSRVFDTARARSIPIAIMRPNGFGTELKPVVLISHGYNENLPGTYLKFSSIAEALSLSGYAVVSVQHENPEDELLPMHGDLRLTRRPNWERGVQNLRSVIAALREREPGWNLEQVDLIGHSNGGDISMLFATQYPEEVRNAISLDNRRMPLPRTGSPHIGSLRAEDAPADHGVLPTASECATFNISLIPMTGFKHVDFNDRANTEQRTRLNAVLLELLKVH